MGKVRKVVFYVLMFALTFAFCILVLEYGVARFYYSDVHQFPYRHVFDPLLGWRLKPGTYFTKAPHALRKHRIYINRHGLRNRDIESGQENVTRRIVILGDSFVFSELVREESIFSSQLEYLLNKSCPGKYEVINTGVIAYGNAQELLHMQRLLEEDIVGDLYLLVISTNDILDNLRLSYRECLEDPRAPGFTLNSEGGLELEYLPQKMVPDDVDTYRPVKRTRRRFEIIPVLKSRIESYVQTRPAMLKVLNRVGINPEVPRVPGFLNAWYQEDILNRGIPLMKALIREIRNEAKRNNAALLCCLIPSSLQVYPDTYRPLLKRTFPNEPKVNAWLKDKTRPQRKVREMCEELGLLFLDLYPVLYQNNRSVLYIPRDGHFNVMGHTVVAQSLAQYITRIEEKEEKPLDKDINPLKEFELDQEKIVIIREIRSIKSG